MKGNWLFRGDWKSMHHPVQALFLSPILAVVPVLLFDIHLFLRFGSYGPLPGNVLVLASGVAIASAIPMTLLFVVIPFLVLSRFGYGGLLPTLLISSLPAFICIPCYANEGLGSRLFIFFWVILTSNSIASGYWFLARSRKTLLQGIERLITGQTA